MEENLLRVRIGPVMPVSVRWQIQSSVSHSAMSDSEPPVARYRAVGCSSVDRHEAVWPKSLNSDGGLVNWLNRIGSNSGYVRIRVLPSPVVTKIFLPPQQKAIWLVWVGCWCEATGVGLPGSMMKMLSVY